MKNKLKLAVAAVTLVVVGLVAVHPGAGSSGDAVQAGLVPHINVPVSRWDDLLNWLRWWKRAPVIRMTLDDLLRQHVARQVDDATRSLAPHERVQSSRRSARWRAPTSSAWSGRRRRRSSRRCS